MFLVYRDTSEEETPKRPTVDDDPWHVCQLQSLNPPKISLRPDSTPTLWLENWSLSGGYVIGERYKHSHRIWESYKEQ